MSQVDPVPSWLPVCRLTWGKRTEDPDHEKDGVIDKNVKVGVEGAEWQPVGREMGVGSRTRVPRDFPVRQKRKGRCETAKGSSGSSSWSWCCRRSCRAQMVAGRGPVRFSKGPGVLRRSAMRRKGKKKREKNS